MHSSFKLYKASIIILIMCIFSVSINMTSVFATNQEPIIGETNTTKEEIIQYYKEKSPTAYPQEYLDQGVDLEKFVDLVIQESNAEGIRADLVFAQIIVETNWLAFNEQVNITQNNFGGLKSQDGNYLLFDSIQEGIKANIKTLKGYAEDSENVNSFMDPECKKKIKEYLEKADTIQINSQIQVEQEDAAIVEEDATIVEETETVKEVIENDILTQEGKKQKNIDSKSESTLNMPNNLIKQETTTNIIAQPVKIKTLDIDGSGYVGEQHEITSLGESSNGVLYQFWIKDLSTSQWTMIQDYSRSGVRWTPTKPGKYLYGVHIKDINSTESLDAHLYKEITIKTAEIKTLEIDGMGYVGEWHEITSLGKSPNGVLYQFWIKDLSTNQWAMIQDYSRSGVRWTPTKPGKYWYGVHIKDMESNESLNAYLYKEITINKMPAEVKTLEIDGPGYVGVRHEITSLGKSPNGVNYQFWIKDLSENKWTMIQDYSRSGAGWIPTKPGKYWYGVHIKDVESNESLNAYLYKEITINKMPAEVKTLEIDGPGYVGVRHEITSLGKSPNGVNYQFWIKDLSENKWTMIQDYSRSGAGWIPTKPGKYLYGVHIKDVKSNENLDAHLYKEISILGSTSNRYISGKTIMLDPGHGGNDPGAVNGSIYEVNLNNSLANILTNKLKALGANVIFTRDPNSNIRLELEERATIANSKNPDLFLSIHHDWARETGYSIHYSSYRPNLDLSGAYFIDKNGKKQYIIAEDGRTQYYIEDGQTKSIQIGEIYAYDETPSMAAIKSKSFSNELYRQMLGLDFINARKRSPVEDHNLAVTRWTNIPSVLIEAGPTSPFMDDANKHDSIADKIVKAMEIYFKN